MKATSRDEVVAGRITDCQADVISCNVFIQDIRSSSAGCITLSDVSVLTYGMKELVQTCKKRLVKINDIFDFAFVFSLPEIQS